MNRIDGDKVIHITARQSLPLLAAQREIFLSHNLDTTGVSWNIAIYTEIPGLLDLSLFEAALRRVVGETEALRVRFVEGPE